MGPMALRLAVVGTALWVLAACGGGGTTPPTFTDSGTARDAGPDGPNPLVDAGNSTGRDSGSSTGGDGGSSTGGDGGSSTGGDGGGSSTTCEPGIDEETGVFQPLGDACLPRCSEDTLAAFAACETPECQRNAADADTTPGVPIGDDDTLDCGLCVSWQANSCLGASCPEQWTPYIQCAVANPDDTETACATQITALNTCITDNQAAIQTCANNRIVACFP
jgi:hypothetical protein